MSDAPHEDHTAEQSEDSATDAPVAAVAETAPPVRSAGRRQRGVLIALAVVVALALGGAGYAWWRSKVTSPEYSLGQLAHAISQKDWAGVAKYVDTDAVTSEYVDAVIAKIMDQDDSDTGELGALAQAMKPQLVQQARESWKAAVQGGVHSKDTTSAEFAAVFETDDVAAVTVTGDEALARVRARDPKGKPYELQLELKRDGDHWRVIGVQDLIDLPFLNER